MGESFENKGADIGGGRKKGIERLIQKEYIPEGTVWGVMYESESNSKKQQGHRYHDTMVVYTTNDSFPVTFGTNSNAYTQPSSEELARGIALNNAIREATKGEKSRMVFLEKELKKRMIMLTKKV